MTSKNLRQRTTLALTECMYDKTAPYYIPRRSNWSQMQPLFLLIDASALLLNNQFHNLHQLLFFTFPRIIIVHSTKLTSKNLRQRKTLGVYVARRRLEDNKTNCGKRTKVRIAPKNPPTNLQHHKQGTKHYSFQKWNNYINYLKSCKGYLLQVLHSKNCGLHQLTRLTISLCTQNYYKNVKTTK
jgi:hypothetical protein